LGRFKAQSGRSDRTLIARILRLMHS